MFLISLASLSLPYSYFFVGYTRKKFPDMTSDSRVKIALRNKITCPEAMLKKRQSKLLIDEKCAKSFLKHLFKIYLRYSDGIFNDNNCQKLF